MNEGCVGKRWMLRVTSVAAAKPAAKIPTLAPKANSFFSLPVICLSLLSSLGPERATREARQLHAPIGPVLHLSRPMRCKVRFEYQAAGFDFRSNWRTLCGCFE